MDPRPPSGGLSANRRGSSWRRALLLMQPLLAWAAKEVVAACPALQGLVSVARPRQESYHQEMAGMAAPFLLQPLGMAPRAGLQRLRPNPEVAGLQRRAHVESWVQVCNALRPRHPADLGRREATPALRLHRGHVPPVPASVPARAGVAAPAAELPLQDRRQGARALHHWGHPIESRRCLRWRRRQRQGRRLQCPRRRRPCLGHSSRWAVPWSSGLAVFCKRPVASHMRHPYLASTTSRSRPRARPWAQQHGGV
mmetsp:Transcript_135686/g.377956  ORF Transcript_135686/g.377956 Transcript_135686/m.377956 type:complete len:254 (+) Transcript_135686:358-1119(+)